MSNFGSYAQFYEALYRDKDYNAECDFLERIFTSYETAKVNRILDAGCGAGGHGLILAQRGYRVTGIDLSKEMIGLAQAKASSHSDTSTPPHFFQADIREVDLKARFDAVISMFSVMGYMVTTQDVFAALRTARMNLQAGGLYVFDAWYGPTVLMEKPVERLKIVEDNGERIFRFARPALDVVRQTVCVHYTLLRLQGSQVVAKSDEQHIIRYFFPLEVAHYLEDNGFRVREMCPFLRLGESIGERDWNFTVIAEAC
jgi:SAM-dependent methyltransferase